MAPFRHSKPDDDRESRSAGSNADSSISQHRFSEADERTRLLPPPAAGGFRGYLSPDDPAVSSILSARPGLHFLKARYLQ